MLPPWAAFRPIGGWAWTRPGAVRLASTAPGHPASNRQLGPGPPPRSRERESCEAPGGSSRSRLVLALGCEAARQTAMARIVERNIHRRFLFSSSTNNLQLLSRDLTVFCTGSIQLGAAFTLRAHPRIVKGYAGHLVQLASGAS